MRYCIDDKGYAYQLQRCPFCGLDVAEVFTQSEQMETQLPEDRERYTIVCSWHKRGCGATCGFHNSVAEAVSRWNTRVVI